jgi:hypothetical protein
MLMIPGPPENPPRLSGDCTDRDAEVVELRLLLPTRQAAALEAAAHQRGLTVGQMIRRLLRDSLDVPK